jgi:trk system potassium uptake protein TrkA
MATTVIIVGGGRVGVYLAALLLDGGRRVTLIEAREAEAPRLRRDLPAEAIMLGSGTDPSVLEAAGIRRADVVVAVTGRDETNLVVAGLARFAFGTPRTIARVNDPGHAWLFTPAMGVDVALDQAELLGHLVAEELSLGDMLTLLKLRKGQYALVEERVHPRAVAAGAALGDLRLPAECALAAVIRGGQLLIPRAGLVLHAGDEVLAVVHAAHAADLAALLGPAEAAE